MVQCTVKVCTILLRRRWHFAARSISRALSRTTRCGLASFFFPATFVLRMKWVTGFVILLGSRLVSALPPPSPFVLQQPGSISDAGLNSVQVDNDESQAILPHLNAQDFHSIEAVKQSIEHGAVSILDRILNQVKKIMTKSNEATDGFEITAIEDTVESLPPRHPPVVIDLSHLTILEIVNASLGHHGKCGHSEASAPSTFEDRLTHDPKHLPLHRLAWIVNRTTEAHKLLEKGQSLHSRSSYVPSLAVSIGQSLHERQRSR